MYSYINENNQCSVSFAECECLVSQVPAPSLSEIIREARQTGQMPYSCQRVPIPSYTDDLDSNQFFDGCDKVAGQVNAIRFSDSISRMEAKLADDQKKLAIEKSEKSSAEHSGADVK